MKFSAFIIVAIISEAVASSSASDSYFIKFFKCECTVDALGKWIYDNFTCGATTTADNKLSTLSVDVRLRQPLQRIWVSGFVEYTYEGKVQKIDIKRTELCEDFAKIEHAHNPVFLPVYEAAKKVVPHLVHACPYTDFQAHNVSIDKTLIAPTFMQDEWFALLYISATESDVPSCFATILLKKDFDDN